MRICVIQLEFTFFISFEDLITVDLIVRFASAKYKICEILIFLA